MTIRVEDWGFGTDDRGRLQIGGCTAEDLAARHGTPLTVFHEPGLRRRAANFRSVFAACYPGQVSVHYALKCNSTPAVVKTVLGEGLAPEVCTPYEWELARRLGADPASIIVNGPSKDDLIARVIDAGAGLVVLDGPGELVRAERLAAARGRTLDVLLRVNPDVVPRGMNRATATASRTASVFGFDLATGEVEAALRRLAGHRHLVFHGFHLHVGTGIRGADEHARALEPVLRLAEVARELGLETRILDAGGGFGVPTSRELTTREFLAYQALGWLPGPPDPNRAATCEEFARSLAGAVAAGFTDRGMPLPRLVLEPGRSLVSQAGALLVRVQRIKERSGLDPWIVCDGGAGTVAFPLYYEYHEILLARDPAAEADRRYSLVGSCCHSADWLYRRKKMPALREGDVLAICDAGAYFTAQERGFGAPRPAMVFAGLGGDRVVRRRETFADMVGRDLGLADLPRNVPADPPAPPVRTSRPARDAAPVLLGPADAEAVAALAREAFGDHPFYTEALGLDVRALAVYWRTFFRFALEDPTVRVWGRHADGELVAAVAAADHRFPTWRAYLRFLRTLARRLGPRAFLRYFRFAWTYQRFMARRGHQDRGEVRGLWLMASPGAGGAGHGSALVRGCLEILRDEGRKVVTALVDGSDDRLLGFYRRIGFRPEDGARVRGQAAVRVELALKEETPCPA